METQPITATIMVAQTPEAVFEAINNPSAWWTGEFTGSPAKLGDEFTYRYQDMHFSKQRVVEFVPNERVAWQVTESHLSFIEDHDEWTGTTIIFEIEKVGGKTQLNFTHEGITPAVECFDACSGAWTQLIQQGLFSFITTGKAEEVPL